MLRLAGNLDKNLDRIIIWRWSTVEGVTPRPPSTPMPEGLIVWWYTGIPLMGCKNPGNGSGGGDGGGLRSDVVSWWKMAGRCRVLFRASKRGAEIWWWWRWRWRWWLGGGGGGGCLGVDLVDSKLRLFQNLKSTSSWEGVVVIQEEEGLLVFGGLIWRDKSGCAGNSSIRIKFCSCFFSFFVFVVVLDSYFSRDLEICWRSVNMGFEGNWEEICGFFFFFLFSLGFWWKFRERKKREKKWE